MTVNVATQPKNVPSAEPKPSWRAACAFGMIAREVHFVVDIGGRLPVALLRR